MLIVPGTRALSPARLEKRLIAIRASNPRVTEVYAEHVHFVDVEGAIDDAVLSRLLTYGPRETRRALEGQQRFVVPRLGTISPWSSKATDIARICGLTNVRRIERGVGWTIAGAIDDESALLRTLHDRMTESVLERVEQAEALFEKHTPRPVRIVPIKEIARANRELGLALSGEEVAYLESSFDRDPSDVELMMFAQANSEHCRHKIFNATFTIDGQPQTDSLFQMIRKSTAASPAGVLSAYKDNASVIEGSTAGRFFADSKTGEYAAHREPIHILMKVETHNHPTAISPYPGAATGSGGEIRDEGATGRGSKPKAGLTGFTVSNLRIPGLKRPWEIDHGKPGRIASALDIMIEGPLGGAAFNNEFGRPNINGYFRTFELDVEQSGRREVRGYHKPIMIAGGVGNIRAEHVHKGEIPDGAAIIVLGGAAMLIGLGGGAASSVAAGTSHEDLDFASVQRDNAEMERRCQEVIDRCWALGDENPIASIHDVGAGGLSNALPELVHESKRGARFDLRRVPNDEPGMSPLEIWCNEAQERYVLAVPRERVELFASLCARERAPFAVLGHATSDGRLSVDDPLFNNRPIDVPLDVILGKPPKMERTATSEPAARAPFEHPLDIQEAALRVLRLPTVADKTFLITIGDRTVTGLVARDPMVGPWQVPVSDCAITSASYDTYAGEAMAMGERPPIALLDAAASARMAIGETITNLAAAPIKQLSDVKLSANWMAAAGHPGEDARLYAAVHAAGAELCPALGIAIPVGKDSMSMRTVWEDKAVIAPLSLIVSGFAPVTDVRRALTPELRRDVDSRLVLIDLGAGKDRLGGSCVAQVFGALGDTPPDLDDPAKLVGFFDLIQSERDRILAYHDRSDGGLFVTLVEMAFAGGAGVDVTISGNAISELFAEELGAVVQLATTDVTAFLDACHARGLWARELGAVTNEDRIHVRNAGTVLDEKRTALRAVWSETTHALQRLRDDPACADEEQSARVDPHDPGMHAHVTFDLNDDIAAPFVARGARPRVAILREQGVNGQIEMAAAFDRAGFAAVDVHMTDVIEGRVDLASFRGLAACGGFSYGDVLGAGEGWAKSILFNARARGAFERFFQRPDTFTLGVCNGCQMMSALKEIVPGAEHWPRFVRNRSEQFEARLLMVEVLESPSILLRDMAGARLPIAVAHGEGRAEIENEQLATLIDQRLVSARFVDHAGRVAHRYPHNPNGSPLGLTSVTTPDGRVTIIMPHPERVFRTVQHSWHPRGWREDAPWMRLFRNARVWVG